MNEDLLDVLDHYGFAPLMAELEAVVVACEANVLKLNLSSPNAAHELLIAKARAEGARQTIAAFKQRLDNLKPRKSKRA